MSCCADPRASFTGQLGTVPDALLAAVKTDGDGSLLTLHVPDIHCAQCLSTIEDALGRTGANARVNLTRRTVSLRWTASDFDPARPVSVLRDLGFTPQPLATESRTKDPRTTELVRAVGVSGFAAMNVMLLSVSVWSGADGSTAAIFNWFSALIALPALAYASRPFIRSALGSLSVGKLNMDVPISLAIVLAAALSLAKTVSGTGETYFDAAVTLTFFLLVGRLADHLTRERARASVSHLAAMRMPYAYVVSASGPVPQPVEHVRPCALIEVAAGERVPLDAQLTEPRAAFDVSLATGESEPEEIREGGEVMAGALAISGPHRLRVIRPAEQSYVARLETMQAAAEAARSRPARIADQAAKVYAPAVHGIALLTFLVWLALGTGWVAALTTAIAVLIITCPCALGLAVPAVHVAACDRLFRAGIAIKDGAAVEALRACDEVIFDKTGTLTTPTLSNASSLAPADLSSAAALARHSTHPVSRAVVAAAKNEGVAHVVATGVSETRGRGVQGVVAGRRVYLGRGPLPFPGAEDRADGLVFAREGEPAVPLQIAEELRPGAAELVQQLHAAGFAMTILSGDQRERVAEVARRLRIEDWHAGLCPEAKVDFVAARREAGARPLMVGDGLNDGPALALATASIAPAGASDLSRAAADLVLTGSSLQGVWTALVTARRAHHLILQNFGVAVAYNCIAVPIAVLGHASPLMAALAMSTSSIIVTLNAVRLAR